MAGKTLFFMESYIETKVAGIKILTFAISTQIGTIYWDQKGLNMKFLKQLFNFQLIRNTETILPITVFLLISAPGAYQILKLVGVALIRGRGLFQS